MFLEGKKGTGGVAGHVRPKAVANLEPRAGLLGRVVALQKPHGAARGTVAGGFL